ncbi:MAG: hypothetical protein ACXVII_35830 [Solirubrobacteraceae bacterium]
MTPTHRITTAAAIMLSLAAAGAPTASARPADSTPAAKHTPTTVYSRPDKSLIPVAARSPSGGTVVNQSAPPTVVRIQTPQSGFDWADAGIGAAGGLALAMLGLGGALLISQRPRRTRNSTVQPS